MARIITGHKWPERFLALADHVGQWSKHERFRIGAVIVRPDRTIVSTGYNGAPRGVAEKCVHEGHSRTIHAEANAILSSHVSVKGCELFCSWPPCDRCAGIIIQSGITRVSFMAPPKASLEKWAKSFDEARALFREAGVEVIEYVPVRFNGARPTKVPVSTADIFDDLFREFMVKGKKNGAGKSAKNAKKAPPRAGRRQAASRA